MPGIAGGASRLNREAVDFAIKAALACGCDVQSRSVFARKNYFYPDLPKGYQISQFERPLALGGGLDITVAARRTVGITRIHMEEDAGKSLHEGFPDSDRRTYVDYNRSGVPLIEIVSEPDIRSAAEAAAFFTRLRRSSCGSASATATWRKAPSLRRERLGAPSRADEARHQGRSEERQLVPLSREGARVRDQRQIDVIEAAGRWCRRRGSGNEHRTHALDAQQGRSARLSVLPRTGPATAARRRGANRTRALDDAGVARGARSSLCCRVRHPGVRRGCADAVSGAGRLLRGHRPSGEERESGEQLDHGRTAADAQRARPGDRRCADAARCARWSIALIDKGTISSSIAKGVFAKMYDSGRSADDIVSEEGLAQNSNEGALSAIVAEVIKVNDETARQYRAGKKQTFGFLVGQVMKASGGKANPKLASDLVKRALES